VHDTSIAVTESVTFHPAAERRARFARGRVWILAGGDILALAVAYAGTYVVANRIAPPAVTAPTWLLVTLALIAVPVWTAVFTSYHLYDNDHRRIAVASFDEVGDIFHALLAGSLAFLLLAQVLRRLDNWWIYSALEAALFLTGALVLVPLVRGTTRTWIFPRIMQRRRTLIVGGGSDAILVHRKLQTHPEYALDVVGFLADSPDPGIPGPVLGRTETIAHVVEEFDVERILFAVPTETQHMVDLLRKVRRPDVQISIIPSYSEIFTSRATLDDIEGTPVVTLPEMSLGRSSRLLKRSFDVTLSALALVVLLPLFIAIAALIRLDSPGPIVYRQPRRGRDGTTFRIAKFRSMYVGAEQRRSDVLHMNDVDGPLFKVKGRDPRVTRIGAFLRRSSLDELPQLWNVLRGDMSLVGPRPFVVYEADQITGWARRRLAMTPGITGLWQVLGRNDIPFDEMVKLDYLYVTNWSLWWDLKILCQTIPVVLRRRGAY
jgi:exopolysaccharide biosynthesis polyprenyl glycosylphosphotransferase